MIVQRAYEEGKLFEIMNKVFANGPGDRGSIPGRVIPEIVLDTSFLNTQYYEVQIKDKWSYQGKGVAPSPSLRFGFWFGFMAYQTLLVILCQIHFYAYQQFYFKQFSLA